MKYDVFLSYSRHDSSLLRQVRDDLRARGLRVWTDDKLEPGTPSWESEIEQAIRNSQCFAVLLSPAAYESEWVRSEITLADSLERRIFPLLIEGDESKSVPLRLMAVQRIDARSDYYGAVEALASAIKRHIGDLSDAPTERLHPLSPAPPRKAGPRIPLALGVLATLAVLALVVLALVLSAQPSGPSPVELTGTALAGANATVSAQETATQQAAGGPWGSTPPNITRPLQGAIVFVSNRDAVDDPDFDYGLYVMGSDGANPTLLYRAGVTAAYPAWSRDGSWLAFTLWPLDANNNFTAELYWMSAAQDAAPAALTSNTHSDYWPRPAPDGRSMLFVTERGSSAEIYQMFWDDRPPLNLTNNSAWDWFPDWSPDGRQIVFASDRGGAMEVWRMSADGSAPIPLTALDAEATQPSFSPDGASILFESNFEGDWEIYRMNADGTAIVNLSNAPAVDDRVPVWSPDGAQIAFVSFRDGDAEIYVMDADGANQTNISNHPAQDYAPAWRRP